MHNLESIRRMRHTKYSGNFEIQTDHPNHGQTTRPSDSQQKEKEKGPPTRIVDFVARVDH